MPHMSGVGDGTPPFHSRRVYTVPSLAVQMLTLPVRLLCAGRVSRNKRAW